MSAPSRRRKPLVDVTVYCTSKYGCLALTECGAVALAEHNITVNGYAPGVVVTPLWEQLDKDLVEIGFKEKEGQAYEDIVETNWSSSACPIPTTSPERHRSSPARQRLHDRPDDLHRWRLGAPSNPAETQVFNEQTGARRRTRRSFSHVARPDAEHADSRRTSNPTGNGATASRPGATPLSISNAGSIMTACAATAWPDPAEPAELACGIAAAVRREQHPLRLGHQDRRVGAGQDVPLLPADGRRQPLCLGLRLGRRAPQRYSDWLEPDHCLAGVVGMRGTIPPEFG
jgi:hypothetical protein